VAVGRSWLPRTGKPEFARPTRKCDLDFERQRDQPGKPRGIEFRDVFGARHRTKAQYFNRITESTPETRAALREFRRARRNEDREGEDPFDWCF
jgi:hypothetical protein